MSRYDSVNRNVLSRVRKVVRDGADVTSCDRQFQTQRPATENARLPTVEWWPEAGWGSHCRKSEALGDFEGRQRKWTGHGKTVHSRGGPCIPGRQPWTWYVQEHTADEGWWVHHMNSSPPLLKVSSSMICVNTWITTGVLVLIDRPRRDGRLSWPGWLTHSGQFTHKVVTCQP